MNRSTPRTLTTILASLAATVVLASAATAGNGPTGLSGGAGCSIACIESALVTPTASSASVEVRTSVATAVTIGVAKVGAPLGLATGTRPKHVSLPSFLKVRTILFPGLEPETAYRIVVSARDLSGNVHTRAGTFITRKVEVAVDVPDLGLSAGLGCKADCIEKGTLTSDASVPGRVRLEVRSTVPATFQVRFVGKSASGATHQLVHATGSRKIVHVATIDGLLTGTRYAVTVKATDAEGRSREESGTFRTRSAQAVVTFHKVVIVDDGDKGPNRGEITLEYRAGGEFVHSSDFARYGSGDTVVPRMPGTSRAGVWKTVSIDGLSGLGLAVGGDECDALWLSNCVIEVGGSWSSTARTTVDLRAALVPGGALPPGPGTGLPAGHDAYAIFETTRHSLKFRVYATVDLQVA
jgi:hypothetical protein